MGTSVITIVLLPPGNLARDLALYRRRLFSATGEASALAFPECAFLASRMLSEGFDGPVPEGTMGTVLAGAWAGIEGEFGPGEPFLSGNMLFMALTGPFEPLGTAATEILGLDEGNPVPGAKGFFLMRAATRDDPEGGEALEASKRLAPPRLTFRDASLSLFRFDIQGDPFRGASWVESLRVRRPSNRRR